ncbi:MAG: SNF2-related protein [Luteolibacter sp.]|nr:SNF2-related protein [Luteolibacter sp.]
MSGWSEETLRTAASWKAFKEGKSLFERGAVIESKAGQSSWRGAVTGGKRPFRVSVTMKSASDIEARCSCPENQSSGEICAHAVAVGLAALVPHPALAQPAQTLAPTQNAPVVAREILFAPNWRESLSRGKFTATLGVSKDAGPTPADFRLTEWLAEQRVAEKEVLNLHLEHSRAAAFLEAISGHPAVFAGKDRKPMLIATGQRLKLADTLVQNGAFRLSPAPDSAEWSEIGGSFWRSTDDALTRAGEGIMPASLASVWAALARGAPVEIPVRSLLENLETWQDWLGFPADGWLDSLHFVPAASRFHLTLEGSLQHLEARLSVVYGDAPPLSPGLGLVHDLPRLAGDRCEIRDLPSEERAIKRLEIAGFQPIDRAAGSWVLRGESSISEFLTRALPDLRDRWSITEGPRFGLVRKDIVLVSPAIEILGSGVDWLSFDLKFQTSDGTQVPTEEVRRLLRSGKAAGKISGGRRLIVSSDMMDLIDPLFSELDLEQAGGHFEVSARSGEVIREIRKKLHQSPISSDLNTGDAFVSPVTLKADLRPYQALGAAWLLDRVRRFGGALLADDMGLGKTVQTIALIESLLVGNRSDTGLVLVVATTSLLGNWRAEFARFAPARRVRILHGAGRDEERERVGAGEVILTSYGTLARDLAWHLKREYRAVVVDEASLMRNPDTDHAKAVSKLKGSCRVALTGTPVENSIRDLWSVFRFIQPGWLGGREEFRERYELPLASGEAAASVMERLRLKTSPFLLRRTKEQVAPELPSKLLIDEFCDLSPDQQTVYRELLIEGRRRVDAIADSGNPGAARMQMLTALLRLRQTCCDLALFESERFKRLLVARRSAKLQRLLELLEEAVNGNHKVLVFSQFQKQLVEIGKCVSERGWDCLRLDGQTRNRQQLVDKFQAGDGPPVFLISLKAGGYGLNLTTADTVVHFDPWWNPAAEAQATDRAHRIGQTRPVTVYRLLTRDTVEEKVVRLQAKKRNLAAAIDENGGGEAAGWKMEELASMLG